MIRISSPGWNHPSDRLTGLILLKGSRSLCLRGVVSFLLFWNSLEASAAPPSADYGVTPAFSDEFNGLELDTAVWTQTLGTPANLSVSDGSFHITTLTAGATVSTTVFQQRFGYYEVRLRTGEDTALVNGAWMGTPEEMAFQDVDRLENNIVETHDFFDYSTDYHDWAPAPHWHSPREINVSSDLSQDFHTYGFEWTTDNQLFWYFDGMLVRSPASDPSVAHNKVNGRNSVMPVEFRFTTWIPPETGTPGPNIDQTKMSVDYVRIYQKPGWIASGNGNWTDPANWGPDGVPSTGRTAIFNRPANGPQATVVVDANRPVQSLNFDTADIPAYTITGGDLLLGSLLAEPNTISGGSGVGGVMLNNTVVRSQSIASNIVGQRQLTFANLTASAASVRLDIQGDVNIASGAPDNQIATLGFGEINIAGQIGSGVGDLNKDGRGILRLSGANQYTGATYVKDGILIIAADSLKNQPGALGNSTALVRTTKMPDDPNFNQSWKDDDTRDIAILIEGPHEVGRDIKIGNYNIDGTTTLGGNTADLAVFSGEIKLSREIQVTAVEGGTVDFSGSIIDCSAAECAPYTTGSLTKIGEGTVNLRGSNIYTGPTRVQEGTLLVNSATHASSEFSVEAGATLGGSGDIGGQVVVESGGTLSPGDSVGTLDLAGGLELRSGAITSIELTQFGFDSLDITGTAILAGELRVSLLSGFNPALGDEFEIISTNSGTISGMFDTTVLPSLSGSLDWKIESSSSSFVLEVVLPGDFDSDGVVDGSDFLAWQRGESTSPFSSVDLASWQANFGTGLALSASATTIPEPITFLLLGPAALLLLSTYRLRRQFGGYLACVTCTLLLCDSAAASDVELYAINSYELSGQFPQYKSDLLRVDPATGAGTFVAELSGSGAATLYAIDFSSTGQLYGVTYIGDLVTIDVLTGAVSFVGTPGGPESPFHLFGPGTAWGLAFSPADEPYLFASNGVSRSLMKLDLSDGTVESLVALTPEPFGLAFWSNIDFGPNGRLYGSSQGLYTVDVVSGTATPVLPGFHPYNGPSLDIGVDGVFRGTIPTAGLPTEQWGLATIDPSSGEATLVSGQNDLPGAIVGLASRPVQASGDFDLDGDVDGRDLLLWQRGESSSPLSQTDLIDWQANYGTSAATTPASTSVPEPSTWIALLFGTQFLLSGSQNKSVRAR